MAAGQIAAQGGSVISEANRVNGGIGGSGVHPIQRGEVADIVDDPQIVIDRRVLGHVSDPVAQLGPTRPVGPSTVTVPAVMIWVPTMLRISVVLPQPDGPSRPVMVPRAIWTDRSWIAGRLPRITRRWSMTTTGSTPRLSNSSLDEVII